MTYAATASTERIRATALGGLPAVLLGLSVAPILAANGGYYPLSWGWSSVILAWGALIVGLVRSPVRPARAEVVYLGLLTAFAVWIGISMAWTSSQTETALELERVLVYVAGVLATLCVVRLTTVRVLIGSLFAGMAAICVYALVTRLFPGAGNFTAFGGYRLSRPVGYWNGLGLTAGMTTVLGVGVLTRGAGVLTRAAAAAILPATVATLYFTFSRGAWLSLFFGLIVLFAVERRRLQFLVRLAPVAAIVAFAVSRASQEDALTHSTASLTAAASQGHSFATLLLGLAVVAVCATLLVALIERFVPVSRPLVVLGWIVVAVAFAAAAGALVSRYGSPASIATRAYDSFTGSPAGGTNLNNRLFSLSSNGRIPAWHVAWRAFDAHPVGGIGAGGFEAYWDHYRTIDMKIRDAHNLYVETLAEEGAVGFALLVAMFLTPFAVFRRARREPFAAAALAALATYILEAAADWDWELSGVTLAALLCGAAVLAAGRRDEQPATRRLRVLPLVLAGAVAAAAMVGLVGNLALSASAKAARSGNWSSAAADARRAHTWAPWSSEPYEALGQAQLASGQKTAAVDSFRAAIRKDSTNWRLWLDMAHVTHGTTRLAALSVAQKLNRLEDQVQQTSALLEEKP